MQFNKRHFCGLSRNADFRNWLSKQARDLFDKLVETQRSQSCKKNVEFMLTIYREIYARNKGAELEQFIKKRFPYVIEDNGSPRQQRVAAHRNFRPTSPQQAPGSALNKHKVFKQYRPGVLSFPQKKIFVNSDRMQLEATIRKFVSDKTGVDYIIVEDHAYIEYFESRYNNIVDKVPHTSRDIYQYRVINEGQNNNNK